MRVITLIACFLVLVVVTSAIPLQAKDQFELFVKRYNKQYATEEYNTRKQIFTANLKKIREHNSQESSFKLGVNEFADLTHEEYLTKLTKFTGMRANASHVSDVAPPASVDWRTSTKPIVVGPVRELGQCGSSIADVVIDSISSDYSVRFSEDFYNFDPTYITNCTGTGCSGTDASTVWNFILKFGLQWYADGNCPTGPGVGICITGVTQVTKGSESALQAAVASIGPITAVIDASHSSFQLYTSGVYYEPNCSSSTLDLAILIVGYGSTNGQDYWIARNAWGTSWGMKGDILLARNKNNNCGVASAAAYATTVKNCVCELNN